MASWLRTLATYGLDAGEVAGPGGLAIDDSGESLGHRDWQCAGAEVLSGWGIFADDWAPRIGRRRVQHADRDRCRCRRAGLRRRSGAEPHPDLLSGRRSSSARGANQESRTGSSVAPMAWRLTARVRPTSPRTAVAACRRSASCRRSRPRQRGHRGDAGSRRGCAGRRVPLAVEGRPRSSARLIRPNLAIDARGQPLGHRWPQQPVPDLRPGRRRSSRPGARRGAPRASSTSSTPTLFGGYGAGAMAFDADGNLYRRRSRQLPDPEVRPRPRVHHGLGQRRAGRRPVRRDHSTWPSTGRAESIVTDEASGRRPGLRRRWPFPVRLERDAPRAGWPNRAGITIDADGNLWITHFPKHAVQKYSPDGTLLASWGGLGFEEGSSTTRLA